MDAELSVSTMQSQQAQVSKPAWIPYVLGGLTGALLGLAALLVWVGGRHVGVQRPAAAESAAASRRNAIVAAIESTQPAVVTISAAGPREVRAPFPSLFSFPFQMRRIVSMQWIGSGFLIDPDGFIVTNEHVVRGATDLVVSLGDGSSARAELVGSAPRFDLALLRIDTDLELRAARLGDSDSLFVGEWAIAIGSPFGSQLDDPKPSVSVGVISAIGRDIRPPPGFQGSWPYFELLQTDAAINSGNSGGPLVNAAGEVIGVNMAIVATSEGQTNTGVNFSVPINTVKWVAGELREYGEVRIPWVGWRLDEAVPQAVRAQLSLSESDGVLVVGAVEPDSPAARAGIQPGDTVLGINGADPYSRTRADRILFDARVGGDAIEVELLRAADGQHGTVMVEVLENPVTRAERLRRHPRPLG